MAEFLPPSMHEPREQESSPLRPEPDLRPDQQPSPPPAPVAPPPSTVVAPVASPAAAAVGTAPQRKRLGAGPLGRLVSLIVTVGLAWALTVAITAWLLGLFLARG